MYVFKDFDDKRKIGDGAIFLSWKVFRAFRLVIVQSVITSQVHYAPN